MSMGGQREEEVEEKVEAHGRVGTADQEELQQIHSRRQQPLGDETVLLEDVEGIETYTPQAPPRREDGTGTGSGFAVGILAQVIFSSL